VTERQAASCSLRLCRNGSSKITSPAGCKVRIKVARQCPKSLFTLAFRTLSWQPQRYGRPKPPVFFNTAAISGFGPGLLRQAITGSPAGLQPHAAAPAASAPAPPFQRNSHPVTLPPGDSGLATSPNWTGSLPLPEDVVSRAQKASSPASAGRTPHPVTIALKLRRTRIGLPFGPQSIVSALRPAIFDSPHCGPRSIRFSPQARLAEPRRLSRVQIRDSPAENPSPGIAACCSDAPASGHAGRGLPKKRDESRRLSFDTSSGAGEA